MKECISAFIKMAESTITLLDYIAVAKVIYVWAIDGNLYLDY